MVKRQARSSQMAARSLFDEEAAAEFTKAAERPRRRQSPSPLTDLPNSESNNRTCGELTATNCTCRTASNEEETTTMKTFYKNEEYRLLGFMTSKHYSKHSRFYDVISLGICPNGHEPDEILNLNANQFGVCHDCKHIWHSMHPLSTGLYYDQDKVKMRLRKLGSKGYELVTQVLDPRLVAGWTRDKNGQLEFGGTSFPRRLIFPKRRNPDDIELWCTLDLIEPAKTRDRPKRKRNKITPYDDPDKFEEIHSNRDGRDTGVNFRRQIFWLVERLDRFRSWFLSQVYR